MRYLGETPAPIPGRVGNKIRSVSGGIVPKMKTFVEGELRSFCGSGVSGEQRIVCTSIQTGKEVNLSRQKTVDRTEKRMA